MIPEGGAAAAAASVRGTKYGDDEALRPQPGDQLRDVPPSSREREEGRRRSVSIAFLFS